MTNYKMTVLMMLFLFLFQCPGSADDSDLLLFAPYSTGTSSFSGISIDTFNADKGELFSQKTAAFRGVDPNRWIKLYLHLLCDTLDRFQKEIKIIDARFSENHYYLLTGLRIKLKGILLPRFQNLLRFSAVDHSKRSSLLKKIEVLLDRDLSTVYDYQKLVLYQGGPSQEAGIIDSSLPSPPVLTGFSLTPVKYSGMTTECGVHYSLKVDVGHWNFRSDEMELFTEFEGETIPDEVLPTFNRELFRLLATFAQNESQIRDIFERDFPTLKPESDRNDSVVLNRALKALTIMSQNIFDQLSKMVPPSMSKPENKVPGHARHYTVRHVPFRKQLKQLFLTIVECSPEGVSLTPEIPGYVTEAGPFKGTFLYKDKNGAFLEFSQAERISTLSLCIEKLDMLRHPKVNPAARMLRNHWFNNRKTDFCFQYATDFVRYAKPIEPSLTIDETIELSRIEKDKIKAVSLARALSGFLCGMLESSPEREYMFQILVTAASPLDDSPMTAQLPVHMGFNVLNLVNDAESNRKSLRVYAAAIGKCVFDWISRNIKTIDKVCFKIDLKILVQKGRDSRILIHWKDLRIRVSD